MLCQESKTRESIPEMLVLKMQEIDENIEECVQRALEEMEEIYRQK